MRELPVPLPSDEALMQRLCEGDEAAFEELALRFEARLYHFAWRHLRESEAAKDLVQETLLRLWRHKHSFRAGSRLSTWLFAIILNLCRDYLRKNGRLSSLERPEVALAAEAQRAKAPTALDKAEQAEMARLLSEALDALPPLQGKLLRLRNAENLSFEEVSQRLGMSPEAARAAASRAYKKLKSWMKERTGEN